MSAAPMETSHPYTPEPLMADGKTARCRARSTRSRLQCGRAAAPGTTVCATHGASAPQVRRKAQLRLAALVDPAVAVLGREMVNSEGTPMSRLRAAENVLDRAGFPRKVETETDLAKDLLLAQLVKLAAERSNANAAAGLDPIDAEVVEDEEYRRALTERREEP